MLVLIRFFLLLCMLIGEVVFLHRHFKVSLTIGPLVIILASTILLFIFSLFNLLTVGFALVLAASIVLAVWAVFDSIRKPETIKDWVSPAVVLFAGFFIYYAYITRGTEFHVWDEFSHWGLVFKTLMVTNKLPDGGGCVYLLNYPPALNLWQYYVAGIVGDLEANAYFGQGLLIMAGVISVFPSAVWKKAHIYLIYFFAGCLFLTIFNFSLLSLYADLAAGVLFGAGLARLIHFENLMKNGNYALLLLVVMVQPIIKPLGIYFSLILVGCVLALEIVRQIREQSPIRIKALLASGKSVMKIEYLALLLLPLVINFVWGLHVKQYGNTQVQISWEQPVYSAEEITPVDPVKFKADLIRLDAEDRFSSILLGETRVIKINVLEVLQTFSGMAPYHTRLTVTNYINSMGSIPYGNSGLTVIYMLIIILLSVTLMLKTDKAHAGQILSVNLVLVVGFIIYGLLLLFSFIYYFAPYDGSNAPSLTRYLGSYLLAWVLMILGSFSTGSAEKSEIQNPPRPYAILLAGLFVFVFLKIPLQSYIHLPAFVGRARIVTEAIYSQVIDKPLPADSKIYDVWQAGPGSVGLEHYTLRYLLCPVPSNFIGWRLGPPYNKDDMYNIGFSPQQWLDFLHQNGYTHVLVSVGDKFFWNHFGSLFDITGSPDKPHLYKVEQNGFVRLK